MNVYRINLRFDLDDERERMAAEYLQQFPQRGKTTRNRFAVDALCAYISRIEQDDRPLLESIRQMLREEIGGVSITPNHSGCSGGKHRTDRRAERRKSPQCIAGFG